MHERAHRLDEIAFSGVLEIVVPEVWVVPSVSPDAGAPCSIPPYSATSMFVSGVELVPLKVTSHVLAPLAGRFASSRYHISTRNRVPPLPLSCSTAFDIATPP